MEKTKFEKNQLSEEQAENVKGGLRELQQPRCVCYVAPQQPIKLLNKQDLKNLSIVEVDNREDCENSGHIWHCV